MTVTAAEGECIVYDGHLTHALAYARVRIRGRSTCLHRHVWEECFGPIPDGLLVHHVCENKVGINPAHLRLVTRREHFWLHDMPGASRDKPYCKRGHARTPENLYVAANGDRQCKPCKIELQRQRRARAAA